MIVRTAILFAAAFWNLIFKLIGSQRRFICKG